MAIPLWQAHITMVFKARGQVVEIGRTIGQSGRQSVDVAVIKAEEGRDQYSIVNFQIGSTGFFSARNVLRLNRLSAFAYFVGYHQKRFHLFAERSGFNINLYA